MIIIPYLTPSNFVLTETIAPTGFVRTELSHVIAIVAGWTLAFRLCTSEIKIKKRKGLLTLNET